MANPVLTTLAADTWTKVATNVTNGTVHFLSGPANVIYQTYRDTGDSTARTDSEAAYLCDVGESAEISASAGIDVYLKAVGAAATVRVDL